MVVRDLCTSFVKVVCESPHWREHVMWVRDARLEPRKLHWIFAIGPDGWPFLATREDGATSAPCECVNFLALSQLKVLSLEFFAMFGSENSDLVRALMKLCDDDMKALENSVLEIEMDLTGWDDFAPGLRVHPCTLEFILKADMKYWTEAWGTASTSCDYPLGWYDFKLRSELSIDAAEHDFSRVEHEGRTRQWEDAMKQKQLIAQQKALGRAKDKAKATHEALLEWCRERRHSQVKGRPLWLARTGIYDGAGASRARARPATASVSAPALSIVHLPSNLVGWLVEQIFLIAKKYDEVVGHVDAPNAGSMVGKLISFMNTHGNKPVGRALLKRFEDPPAPKSQQCFRLTSDQRNKLWRHWRELMNTIDIAELSEAERMRVVEIDVVFGLLIKLHVYLTKVTISKEEIRDAKQLGRDLHVMYREMNRRLGMKEFGVCIEIWLLLEENFDRFRVSDTHMIGPMILGGMQNLERVHKDDKDFCKRSCSMNKGMFVRLLTLKAILFAANKYYPIPMVTPTHAHAVPDYDEKVDVKICRRCKDPLDVAPTPVPDEIVPEEERLHDFKSPLCAKCSRSADYYVNVTRPGKATGEYLKQQQAENAAVSEEVAEMRARDSDDDDDDLGDEGFPASRVALLADSAEDQAGGARLAMEDDDGDERAALDAAMRTAAEAAEQAAARAAALDAAAMRDGDSDSD